MYTHTQNGKEKKIKRGKCHKSINNDQSVSLLSPISKIVSNSPHTYTYYGRLKWMDGIFYVQNQIQVRRYCIRMGEACL